MAFYLITEFNIIDTKTPIQSNQTRRSKKQAALKKFKELQQKAQNTKGIYNIGVYRYIAEGVQTKIIITEGYFNGNKCRNKLL